ncbi:MAG: phage tail protein [Pseudomonadota bacterium]
MAQAAIAAVKVAASWLAKKGLAQAVVKLGLQLAATSVVARLTRGAPGRNQGIMVQTDLSANSPRRVQVGKRLNGGVFGDWLTKGNINEDTWRIFYLGEGPMGNVTSIFADGRRVFNGTLTHGAEVTLTALDSRVRVRYYDGRPGQTADANLLASGVGWTSNHVGTGCAYCVVYARFHDTKLVVPPDMSFEVEGAKLYDRRRDSTAGGSGSQRLKDPTTWQLSTNPAVALDHYLLGRFLSASDDEPWFGVGLDPALVPYADFAAMANLCDEQVNLKVSGTQDRYAMNGFIFADEVFRDVIRRICDHMNARPADFGGLISMIDGESKVPVLTLDRSDQIDESAEVYKPKAPYSQIVGGVEGRYQDPANNYQPTDYPRYTEAAWKTQDGGETKFVTRDFDYEINQERAERLASLHAKRARRQATLSGVYPLSALILEEGDWFTRTGGKFGAGKVFEVVGSPVLDVETMTVAIQSIEVDPDDSAWDESTATDQAASPDADPTAPALPVPPVVLTAIDVASGGVQIPALRFEHTDHAEDPPIIIEIEVAENDGSNGPQGDRMTMFMVREQQFGIMTGLLPSTGYVARWKGQIGELESAWSSWSPVTTTAGYTVGSAASADIANAIVNQGWGATASQNDADNSRVPLGANSLKDTFFRASLSFFNNWGPTGNGGVQQNAFIDDARGFRYLRATASSMTTANWFGYAAGTENRLSVEAGQTIGLAAFVGSSGCADVRLSAIYYDAVGGYVTEQTTTFTAPENGTSDFTQFEKITTAFTVPANAAIASVRYRVWAFFGSGPTATFAVAMPTLAYLADGQTVGPEPGHGADIEEGGANQTEGRISAGFDDQDYGATASQEEVDNNYARIGGNHILDPYFRLFADTRYWQQDGSGPLGVAAAVGTPDGAIALRVTGSNFTANGQYRRVRTPWVASNGTVQGINVQQGDRVGASVMVGMQGGTSITLYIAFRNSSGAWIQGPSVTRTLGQIGTGTGRRDTFTLVDLYADAPAGAHWAFFEIRVNGNTGQSPDMRFMEPMLTRFNPGQVRMPPFTPQPGAERGADPTGENVAIAIENQGTQANANSEYGPLSARPATDTPGSMYGTSDTGELFYRTASSWVVVANIVPAVMSIRISPGAASGNGTNPPETVQTNLVSVIITGGSGNYDINWECNNGIVPTAPTAVSTRFSKANMQDSEPAAGTAIVTVTDTDTGRVQQASVGVDLISLSVPI